MGVGENRWGKGDNLWVTMGAGSSRAGWEHEDPGASGAGGWI